MLICKVCEGKKTTLNEDTKQVELCPACEGHGTAKRVDEKESFKKQLLRG